MTKPKLPAIKYTSREFDSIKNDLVQYAKRYYTDTFQDFNEASFGSFMLDTVSYIGDILSFYVDYQANESFLDTASEIRNVIKHGIQNGYKHNINPSSFGVLSCFVLLPSKSVGLGPDYDYAPILKQGSEFASGNGATFTLTEDIDFSNTANKVVIATVNSTTGQPIKYAVKAMGKIKSGSLYRENVEVGDFTKFLRIKISNSKVSEIVSVYDSDGNRWYEVDFLSQNTIFKEVSNKFSDRFEVRNILKPFVVPRRFIVEHIGSETFLQFGHGSEAEILTNPIVDPIEVSLDLTGRDFVSDRSFDPSKMLKTDKFGVAPGNTTLSITYRTNDLNNVNAAAGTIGTVIQSFFEFDDKSSLDSTKVSEVINSLETENEEKIVGDVKNLSIEEVKRKIIDSYATQNRAVTLQDYKTIIYSMPNKFGAIKRVSLVQDRDSLKRNINMYLVSEDSSGNLSTPTNTLKNNVKTWVEQYKMINDTIDILNAHIINVGIDYVLVADEEANRFSVLERVATRLKEHLNIKPDIGENFNIADVYNVINKTEGVVDTLRVRLVNKYGGAYSDINYDIEANLDKTGRRLLVPDNFIWEVKYPNSDINGVLR